MMEEMMWIQGEYDICWKGYLHVGVYGNIQNLWPYPFSVESIDPKQIERDSKATD